MIFNAGDTAYIIENGIRVKPVKILSRIGDMYTGENYVRGSAEKKGVSFPI